MSQRPHLKRHRAVTALAATVGLFAGLATAAPAAHAADDSAAAAAAWAAAQAPDGVFLDAWTPGAWDTAPREALFDTAIGLGIAGEGTTTREAILEKVKENYDLAVGFTYIGPVDPESKLVSSLARVIIGSVLAGQDPRSFDGRDMVTELQALKETTGPLTGRFADNMAPMDFDSAMPAHQAQGVLALLGAGVVDNEAIDFLKGLQCADGMYTNNTNGFYPNIEPGCPTGATGDVPTTAWAILALAAASDSGATGLDETIGEAVEALLALQQPDGAFPGVGTVTTMPTALAAQALQAVGEADAAHEAVEALLSRQLLDPATEHAAEAGAVSASQNPVALPISDSERTQILFATSWTVAALSDKTLADIKPETPDPEPVAADSSTTVTAPATVTYGKGGTAAVSVSSAGSTAGTVELLDGTRSLGTKTLASGSASFALPTTLAVGSHRLTARFAPADPAVVKPSVSAVRTLAVTKVKTSTKTKVKKPTTRKKGRVRINVAGAPRANGTAIVRIKGKAVKNRKFTVRVKNGKAARVLPRAKRAGKFKVVVRFKATATHMASRKATMVRVAKAK